MAIVTPTDRPKSVRNRCVIEDFDGVFVLSRCFFNFSVGVGAFVLGLSQISSFLARRDHRVGTKRRYYDSVQLDTTILLWGFIMEHDTR